MKQLGKIKQKHILTAIVGSYPKPSYVIPISGRKLIDSTGFLYDKYEKKIGKVKFKKLLQKASLEAIHDQNSSGIDIITDGEEKRGQYVMYVLKGLEGIDFRKLKKITYRGGIYERNVPSITKPIKYIGPIVLNDFLLTQKNTSKISKIGLPGPSTVADSIVDEYYEGDLEKVAFEYARAIHHEVELLIKAGCQIIQFDDPVLLRFPDRAKKWGIQALEACFVGFEDKATFVVHICRGYPNKPLEKRKIHYKANEDYYKDMLTWFSKSKLDVVSIEAAQSNLDLSILSAVGEKTVMLGVLDVGVNKVETIKSLIKRGEEALKYLPKRQLIFAPDCGMLEISRASAYRKLKNMASAVSKLNRMDGFL